MEALCESCKEVRKAELERGGRRRILRNPVQHEQSLKKGKATKTKKVKGAKAAVTIKKLAAGKKYYFRIRAVRGAEKTSWSKKKTVKVK